MRERRMIFGEVPELYDKARAPYPDALVDERLRFARADARLPHLRALE